MLTLAKLRMALDQLGIGAPIQVFGALDPISSPLYFLAGAEIFDGLTWLRFAYCGGFCVYQGNYTAIHVGIAPDDDFAVSKMFSDNYATLRDLQLGMQTFAANGDYAQFWPFAEKIEKAEKAMMAQLGKDR
jgi:hypothetical protein